MNLQDMTVQQLDAYLDELDAQRLPILDKAKEAMAVRNEKIRAENLAARKESAQLVADGLAARAARKVNVGTLDLKVSAIKG